MGYRAARAAIIRRSVRQKIASDNFKEREKRPMCENHHPCQFPRTETSFYIIAIEKLCLYLSGVVWNRSLKSRINELGQSKPTMLTISFTG